MIKNQKLIVDDSTYLNNNYKLRLLLLRVLKSHIRFQLKFDNVDTGVVYKSDWSQKNMTFQQVCYVPRYT